jgi:hypothetical protein
MTAARSFNYLKMKVQNLGKFQINDHASRL